MIEHSRSELTLTAFAEMYARDTGSLSGDNAFTSKYWREIVVGNALSDLADAGVGRKTR